MPAEQGITFLTIDVARLFRQRVETAMAGDGLGLTAGEARALTFIKRYPRSKQSRLAELMGLEPMTLVSFLDRLESRGFVRRLNDPADRRAKLVALTAAGEPVTARVEAICERLRREATEGLSRAEIDGLRSALLHARERLAGEEA